MKLTIEWDIRESLLTYLENSHDFEVECGGGAEYIPMRGVRLPAWGIPGEIIEATGTVSLFAHGGALAIRLNGLRIDGGVLWINDPQLDYLDDPGSDQTPLSRGSSDEKTNDRSLRLLTLELADTGKSSSLPEKAGALITYETRLTHEADPLFMYNYVPDAPFGQLRVHAA